MSGEAGSRAETVSGAGRNQAPFYGWAIAAAAGLGLASGISVFLPSTIGLLIAPLSHDFGWSPPKVLAALSFNTVATLIAAPVTGNLVDRFGPRRLIIAGLICQAVLIASFSVLGKSLAGLYLRYSLFAFLATGTTAISYSALISRWFDRRRGLALGIALAGVGLGGVIWSILAQYLFGLVGWRAAMLYFAGGLLLLVAPILWLTIRDRPEDMGLRIDGEDLPSTDAANKAGDGLKLKEASRTGRFWLILLTFFLLTAGAYGVMLNLVTILIRQGASPQAAANAQAMIWMAIILGRVSTGWLLDRFFAPRIALGFVLPGIVGTAVLMTGHSPFAAAMLVGLAAGAEIDVLAYLVGRYFGLRHFASIYAVNFGAAALATSVGPFATALIANANGGSYTGALLMLIGVFAAAAALLALFPRFPERFQPTT